MHMAGHILLARRGADPVHPRPDQGDPVIGHAPRPGHRAPRRATGAPFGRGPCSLTPGCSGYGTSRCAYDAAVRHSGIHVLEHLSFTLAGGLYLVASALSHPHAFPHVGHRAGDLHGLDKGDGRHARDPHGVQHERKLFHALRRHAPVGPESAVDDVNVAGLPSWPSSSRSSWDRPRRSSLLPAAWRSPEREQQREERYVGWMPRRSSPEWWRPARGESADAGRVNCGHREVSGAKVGRRFDFCRS